MSQQANETTPKTGGLYSHYVLAILVLVYIFNFIDRNILSILAEEIKADLAISDAQMGFLYGTVFAVFYAVFGIPLARFADVWTRRNLISIGLGFWSLMTAASGLARSFGALAACRIGVGIGEASASPAAYSMLSDYYPPATIVHSEQEVHIGQFSPAPLLAKSGHLCDGHPFNGHLHQDTLYNFISYVLYT